MNKNIRKLVSMFLFLVLCFNSIIIVSAKAQTYTEDSLKLGITKSVSKRFKKTTLIQNRTVEIEYVISGLYTYDQNSGKITSAYAASLDDVSLVKDPGGTNISWDIDISDISVDSSVSSNGAKATFTARFHVDLIMYEGYVPITTYDLGYIQNSVSGTGS